MKTLDEVLKVIYEVSPEFESIKDWSGCNYNVNRGNNELEPVGTAQSMHDCVGCDKLATCLVKQPTPVWEWSEDIHKDLRKKWIAMNK